VPATPTAKPASPTVTVTSQPATPTAKATSPPPTATQPPVTATAAATATPAPAATATPRPPTSLHGLVFLDSNADGELAEDEIGVEKVEVKLSGPGGLQRTAATDSNGVFGFANVSPGAYRLEVQLPHDHVGTTDSGQDIDIIAGEDVPFAIFGIVVPPPDVLAAMRAAADPDAAAAALAQALEASDEQVIALSAVTSLPLRFAEGRDLMAQVGFRMLGDGLVWLGVPFRSQIDGGQFQFVNCGPASLTMVLAAFGLEVGPSQVRDYLNALIDNFDKDRGTGLDVLARIGREAGLTPMDLYSERGGYRNWTPEAVRWHVQQGHPVITLVKYRNLPGHGESLSDWDHYVVISGLTPNGFIYNDAAFATTLGYGLEISDVELVYAWENSSIPHHALALGLDPDKRALSFPETPRVKKPESEVATARSSRRRAEEDEAPRQQLTMLPFTSNVPISRADAWQLDEPAPEIEPVADDAAPMGLQMQPSEAAAVEPRPGPGSMVPRLLVVVGAIWLVAIAWLFSGRLAIRLSRWERPAVALSRVRALLRR